MKPILMLVVLALVVGGQGANQAEVQLQAAIKAEVFDGNLKVAIERYQQIVTTYPGDRPVVAKALVRMGQCYEKLGEAQASEARKAYERVVREFADQKDAAEQARAQLAAISRGAAPSSAEPRFRKVAMATGQSPAGARLSPDGKEMAFTGGGAVWIVPVAGSADPNTTGVPTKLTGALRASGVAWSPDQTTIAFNTPTGIWLIPRSGGEPKETIKSPSTANDSRLGTISVSPDATRLVYSRGRSLTDARVFLAGTGGGTPTELPSGAGNSMAAFSPDGRRLAYVHISKLEASQESGWPIVEGELWIVAADRGNPVMASRLPGWPEGPVWSPDGSMIAFLQKRMGTEGPADPELRILTVNSEGGPVGTPVRITVPFETSGLLAGWTADNKIGIVRYNPEQQAIYRVPATGGRAAQISAKGWMSHPRWSRDGKRILLRMAKGLTGWVSAEGGEVTAIPIDRTVMEVEPLPGGGNSVSPDGSTIVLSGAHRPDRKTNEWHTNIWTVGMEGGQPKQLTHFADPDTRFPCWSPDGQRVAFIARDTDRKTTGAPEKPGSLVFQVYVVSTDGTGLRKVTSEANRVDWSAVAWSPDGRWIAYFTRDKTLNLIPAEGGEPRVVADLRRIDSLAVPSLGGLAFSEVAWSPDGRELAFSFDGRLWKVGHEAGTVTEIRTGLTGVRAIYLDWSPDGRTIAFTGTEGGNDELWLIEDFIHLVKAGR